MSLSRKSETGLPVVEKAHGLWSSMSSREDRGGTANQDPELSDGDRFPAKRWYQIAKLPLSHTIVGNNSDISRKDLLESIYTETPS